MQSTIYCLGNGTEEMKLNELLLKRRETCLHANDAYMYIHAPVPW